VLLALDLQLLNAFLAVEAYFWIRILIAVILFVQMGNSWILWIMCVLFATLNAWPALVAVIPSVWHALFLATSNLWLIHALLLAIRINTSPPLLLRNVFPVMWLVVLAQVLQIMLARVAALQLLCTLLQVNAFSPAQMELMEMFRLECAWIALSLALPVQEVPS